MEIWIDITTPTAIYTRVEWPKGAPHPSVDDSVLLRCDDQVWGFRVKGRLLGIGIDPMSGKPGCQLALTVDTEPPAGFPIS